MALLCPHVSLVPLGRMNTDMQASSYARVESPLGELVLTSYASKLTGIYVSGHKAIAPAIAASSRADSAFAQIIHELDKYWSGNLQEFSVPIAPMGTPFQQAVWRELRNVPYGETVTYLELARLIGRPSAARAVGSANARNPISILIPCHRVIGSAGSLTGYAGGLDKKRWLLAHESAARNMKPDIRVEGRSLRRREVTRA